MKKPFVMFNLILTLLLPIVAINLIISNQDPDTFFPFIFISIAFSEIFLGIISLNDNKKFLGISSFMLASFFLVLVGAKIYLYGQLY